MILKVNHRTVYNYDSPLRLSLQVLRLTPFNHSRQRVLSWQIEAPNKTSPSIDWFGNQSHFLNLADGEKEIIIVAHGLVEVFPAKVDENLGSLHESYYLRHTFLTTLNEDLRLLADRCRGELTAFDTAADKLVLLNQMSAHILQQIPYIRGVTNASTSAIEAYAIRGGVCQDHTHVFLACCRYLGIPARYISGYLYTTDEAHLASHAWAEAWLGNAWHSFDISNQCQAGETHIELAYGLDYLDACPIRGSRIGGGTERISALSYVTAAL